MKAPTRFVIADTGTGPVLACPVCGFEYVHIASVEVAQGSVTVSATNDKVRRKLNGRKNKHRGSQVVLRFFCENGHEFEYVMRFHKGMTMLSLAAHKSDINTGLIELWRD